MCIRDSGHDVVIANSLATNATVQASGNTTLTSAADVNAQGAFTGNLTATGTNVVVGSGETGQFTTIGGALDAEASTGDVTTGFLHTDNATVKATHGKALLDGTLTSTGDIAITANSILGVKGQGAIDLGTANSTTLVSSLESIGKADGTTPNVQDTPSVIQLVNTTNRTSFTISVDFPSGQTAWFGVSSKSAFEGLGISEYSSLYSSTFGCNLTSCFNILGQTTTIADSVIANILNAASQDAADAAFGTDNLDFAIRKGYVTTIGRVPPGIDEIAGDLGATQCDSRVTSATSIAADKACSAPGAPAPKVGTVKVEPKMSATGNLIVY